MSAGNFKHELFNQFARIAKALANGNRLELIEYLDQVERSVDVLAKVAGLSVANTSQHLQQLRQAGLVTTRKEGQKVYYRLSSPDVTDLLTALRNAAERNLADVDRLVSTYLTVRDDLEPIPAHELLKRAREGLITVLDVRPAEEYQAGHIPGAINIPLAELEGHLNDLPADKEVIAYCRGPHCILSFDAVNLLRTRGVAARRLDGGLPEWRQEGLLIEH